MNQLSTMYLNETQYDRGGDEDIEFTTSPFGNAKTVFQKIWEFFSNLFKWIFSTLTKLFSKMFNSNPS